MTTSVQQQGGRWLPRVRYDGRGLVVVRLLSSETMSKIFIEILPT